MAFHYMLLLNEILSSVQLLTCIWLFVTPLTTARQASLSITNSGSILKLTLIELVMPSNHLILCCPLLLLPSIFQMSQLFASGDQSIGVSASTSVLPMNIQTWSPLGWTGWISLQSKRLSRIFSNTIVQKHQFFFFNLNLFILIEANYFTILYWFCHISAWIHHGCTHALLHSAFFTVQLSRPYMTTGETIALIDGPLLTK